MYGFRYHLITVIAIFLALTIGLLLGVALGNSDSADAPTDSMVSSLQESFDQIKSENNDLKSTLQAETDFNYALLQDWASGRLKGTCVVVLGNGNSEQAAEAVDEAVSLAGANALLVDVTAPQVQDEEFASIAADLRDAGVDVSDDISQEDLNALLARSLAQEWTQAGEELFAAQQDAGESSDALSSASSATDSSASVSTQDASSTEGDSSADDSSVSGEDSSLEGDGSAQSSAFASESDAWESCPVSTVLSRHGLLSIRGSFVDLVCSSHFVDVALVDEAADSFVLDLAEELSSAGDIVVSAQFASDSASSSGSDSLVSSAWQQGIAGTASLGSNEGTYSLIALLSGYSSSEFMAEMLSLLPLDDNTLSSDSQFSSDALSAEELSSFGSDSSGADDASGEASLGIDEDGSSSALPDAASGSGDASDKS